MVFQDCETHKFSNFKNQDILLPSGIEDLHHRPAKQEFVRCGIPQMTNNSNGFELYASLNKIKNELYTNKFYHFTSDEMKKLLVQLGAQNEDFQVFLSIFNDGSPSMKKDPAKHDRVGSIRNYLYKKQDGDQNLEEFFDSTARILPHVPARVDDPSFVKLNGGLNYRPYAPVEDWMAFNTVHTALHKIIMSMVDPATERLPTETSNITDFLLMDMFLKNVVDDTVKKASLVSPEGIHQDGNHITFMMMGLRNNIKEGCAQSRVFNMDAELGPYGIAGGKKNLTEFESIQEEMERERCMIFNHTMKDPFEAIMILDREVKHEGRGGLVRVDNIRKGERALLLIFGRRPVHDGWEKDHQGVPFHVAKDEFDREGSVGGLFSESDAEFRVKEKHFYDNLKQKKITFPGQELNFNK